MAADRADLLAGLLDAGVDEQRLALHLLEPHILYPLAGQPVWQGVELLATDHYLVLDGDGAPAVGQVVVAAGAGGTHGRGRARAAEALSAAVDTRVRGRELVSCDLGGVDSTSVCCLAARGDAKVVAYTAATRDPIADDVAWAGRTVAALGTVEHHVIPAEQVPLVFHSLQGPAEPLDEPFSATTERERWLAIARRAGPGLAAAPDRLRRGRAAVRVGRPPARWPGPAPSRHAQLRGFAAKYRWPRGQVLRQLSDRSSYPSGCPCGRHPHRAPPPLNEPLLDWGFAPRLPPWATGAAARTVADQIRARGAAAETLGPGGASTGSWRRCGSSPASPASSTSWPPGWGSPWPPLLRRPGDRGRPGRPAPGAGHPGATSR